jgi:hypothetical protein
MTVPRTSSVQISGLLLLYLKAMKSPSEVVEIKPKDITSTKIFIGRPLEALGEEVSECTSTLPPVLS